MDGSTDESNTDCLSCRSSTLVADSDIVTITATNEKHKYLDSRFSWYQGLPVTEFYQFQLRRLTGKASRDFLVLVLCDQSICCIGLGATEDAKTLPILGSKGTDNVVFYHSSYMSELATTSSVLVNLSFSHRHRDLIELLQILHCVEANLTTILNLNAGNNIWAWTTVMVFERTFCNWESGVAQLQKDTIVGASVITAKAELDSLTNERNPTISRPPIRSSALLAKEKPEPESKSMALLCSILTAEWDSAVRAVNDTLVYDSLGDNILASLVGAVALSARTSAVQAATAAAHTAAKSTAQASAKEGEYGAAWESVWDAAGFEDDIIGRGGLAYIAECVAERGIGVPRSEHESDMRVMRASPCANRPGWLTGCDAGWVGGWRAGRRAATRLSWDAFGEDLPLGEWSEDLDAGWDAAWERASLADPPITRPNVGREVGRTDYNVGWDDGWGVGWQVGYEVGWELGRDGAKLAARRSWRSARAAAMTSAFDTMWDGLGDWGISMVLGKRSMDSSSQNTNALNVSDRRAWDSALEAIWSRAWAGGSPLVQLACADATRQIVVHLGEIDAHSPEITIWSPRNPQGAKGQLCTNAILQPRVIDQLRSLFASDSCKPVDNLKTAKPCDALGFVDRVWADIQCSAL